MPPTKPVEPYEDDIEYLSEEMDWLDARARRLLVQRALDALTGGPEDTAFPAVRAEPRSVLERYDLLVRREGRLREAIDHRLSATRAAGRSLGLDRLVDAIGLGEFERLVVLLAAQPVLAPGLEDVVRGAVGTSSLTIESICSFAELGLRERLDRLPTFSDESLLVATGAVSVTDRPDASPEERLGSVVWLGTKTFEVLTGRESPVVEPVPEAPVLPRPESDGACTPSANEPRGDDRVPNAADVPQERLHDVVVAPEVATTLAEIVAVTRGGEPLLRRWGFEFRSTYGSGLNVLFFGSPGTGKTLAARAIAGELRRPLVEARYNEIVSKWIGESARGVASLFRQAASVDAVVLIDEADGLVAPRGQDFSHPHDDAVTNTLLKMLEEHSGLVVLCTNLRGRLDTALSRRLGYQIEFSPPGPVERVRLWRLMLPETVPVTEPLDFERLGHSYLLSGGTIRNACRRACFRAARAGVDLTQTILEAAAAEEVAAQCGGQNKGVRVVGFSR